METGPTPPPLPPGQAYAPPPPYPQQSPYPQQTPFPQHVAPPPMPYATPGSVPQRTPAAGELGEAQKVFDTVTGPNVRLKDNLIQFACVVVGAVAGALLGGKYGPAGGGVVIGIVLGLFVSLVLSGVVIGIVRFFTAVRRKKTWVSGVSRMELPMSSGTRLPGAACDVYASGARNASMNWPYSSRMGRSKSDLIRRRVEVTVSPVLGLVARFS
jgi:hypothetical protein